MPPIFQSYDTSFMSIFTFEIFLFLQILYRYMITHVNFYISFLYKYMYILTNVNCVV